MSKGVKIRWPQGRKGSSPFSPTIFFVLWYSKNINQQEVPSVLCNGLNGRRVNLKLFI